MLFWSFFLGWVVLVGAFAFNRRLGFTTRQRILAYLVGTPVVGLASAVLTYLHEDARKPAFSEYDTAALAAALVGAAVVFIGFFAALVFETIRRLCNLRLYR